MPSQPHTPDAAGTESWCALCRTGGHDHYTGSDDNEAERAAVADRLRSAASWLNLAAERTGDPAEAAHLVQLAQHLAEDLPQRLRRLAASGGEAGA